MDHTTTIAYTLRRAITYDAALLTYYRQGGIYGRDSDIADAADRFRDTRMNLAALLSRDRLEREWREQIRALAAEQLAGTLTAGSIAALAAFMLHPPRPSTLLRPRYGGPARIRMDTRWNLAHAALITDIVRALETGTD